MMAPRQLERPPQQMINMGAPLGGFFAAAVAFGLGRVQNLLDPAAQTGSGFRLVLPDWLENRERVFGRDRVHRLGTQRRGVRRERHPPLRPVLLVSEPCSQ